MKITTKGNNLIVQLEGVERVWAFKTGLNFKKEDIETISWQAARPRWRDIIAVRCPGTGVPKVLYAGSFISNRGLEFWYLRMREPGFLTIVTSEGRYKTIRLTTSQAVGIQLKKWLGDKTKSARTSPSRRSVSGAKSRRSKATKIKQPAKK